MVTSEHATNRKLINSCPVCGSAERLAITDFCLVPELPGTAVYHLDVARCGGCGHEYQTRILNENQLKKFYRESATYFRNDHANIPQGSLARFWTIARDLEGVVDPSWRHLDVGGFSGHFSSFMKRFLHESHCLDVSSHLKEHPTPGVRVFNQTLFEFATHHQEPAYDFISLNHTLEHLSELKKVRQALKKLLRPAGFLLIEVPAQQSYSPSIVEHTVDHIHYFSAGSLSRFLENDYRLCWLKRFRYAEKDKVDVGATEVLRTLARRQESSATRGKAQRCTARLVATVESRIRNASSVMVWGTGYHTRLLFSLSPLIHEKTTCLIDSDPVRGGRTLYGKRVVHPFSLNDDEKAVLIISSYDYRADIHEAARKHFREENIINPYLSVKG